MDVDWMFMKEKIIITTNNRLMNELQLYILMLNMQVSKAQSIPEKTL